MTFPEWWDWELKLTPHVEKRMEDRTFTEVELRLMLERATGFRADVVDGRFFVETRFRAGQWEVVVEPGRVGASFGSSYGLPSRTMKQRYLEITFRKGKPLAAYLYLPRDVGAKAVHTLDGGHGIRIDLDERGVLIGLEITAPSGVTVNELNGVLARYGFAALKDEEWAPLAA